MTTIQIRNDAQVELLRADFYSREDHMVLSDDMWIELDERAAPALPAADRIRVFSRDDGAGNSQLCFIDSAGVVVCSGGGVAAPHNILSATHLDAAVQAVSRGSLIYGDATPDWNELVIGPQYAHLESDGVDVAWQANLTMADDAWIGLGGAAGRLVFDSTPAPDQVEVTAADLNFVTTGHGIIHVDGVSAGPPRQLLIANGTRYVPGTLAATDLAAHNLLSAQHGDTVVQAVSRGSLIVGDVSPDWNELVHPGGAGYAFTTDANDVLWDQTPAWTGDHTWDDGAGDSPALILVGGSNDDTARVFLDDDAVAGDSDLVVRLCDAAGDSQLVVQDSATGPVAYIDSDGNADFLAHVAIGANASVEASRLLNITDTSVSTADDFYGILCYFVKAAGASDHGDPVYGALFLTEYNQAAGEIGNAYGIASEIVITDGGVGDAINTRDVYGSRSLVSLDGGQVFGDAYGSYSFVDQAAGNTVSDDVFGHYISVDTDGTVTGSAYLLYLDGLSNVNYGIWQNSTEENYLGGPLGVRTTLANAVGLYVPWLSGDADTTAYFGSMNASNDQIAVEAHSYSDIGVYASSETADAVNVISVSGRGGYFQSTSGTALHCQSTTGIGFVAALAGAGTSIAQFRDDGNIVFEIDDGGNAISTVPTGTAMTVNLTGAGTAILDCQDNGTTAFIVDDGGKVGVGNIAAPAELLHLDAGDITRLLIESDDSATGAGVIKFINAATTRWEILAFNPSHATLADKFVIREDGSNIRLAIDTSGHVIPGANKTQDLGLTGTRWRTLYQGTSTAAGTSRVFESTRDCPLCSTGMVRGTGSLCILGEDRDYEVAHCPDCGVMAVEEMKHLPSARLAERRPPPKVEFLGLDVFPMSGNSRKVQASFRYVDGEDEVLNSTFLGETELADLMAMDEATRRVFLLELGRREWEALEELRIQEEEVATLQDSLDILVKEFVGVDLLQQ